ncbi:MAG: PKD domain-containing protein, partial [Methanoregula sp.]
MATYTDNPFFRWQTVALVLVLALMITAVPAMAAPDNTTVSDGNLTVITAATTASVLETTVPTVTPTDKATEVSTILLAEKTTVPTTLSTNVATQVSEAPAPVANFTASATTGVVPMFVRFNDTSTGSPTAWSWDFGDGGSSTVQNATHTYMTNGTFTVNMTATNTDGSDSEVKAGLITVTAPGSSSGGLANTPWPKFGHDLENTGRSDFTGSQTNSVKWSYLTGGEIQYSSPVLGPDGTIYIGDYGDKKVYALNPDGTFKWSYLTGSTVYSSAAIGSDGTIYIAGADQMVYALNPDGSLKWAFPIAGYSTASPTIGRNGIIYVILGAIGQTSHLLYAINPDGTLNWSYDPGENLIGTPAIGSDDTVYIGTNPSGLSNYQIQAVNPNGTLKWSYPVTKSIQGITIGSDGTIYTPSSDNKIYALNPDGTLKWSFLSGKGFSSMAAIGADGTIYAGNGVDKKVYALYPNGTLKWSYLSGGSFINNAPAIGADGTIYIGNYGDKKVYALNPNGTLKWSYLTGAGVRSSPAIGPDGTVYIGSRDKKVYAFAGVVDYTADKTTGTAPLAIQFNGTSTVTPISWLWDFGDGTNSTDLNLSHTYSTTGNFTAKLTLTHASGTNYLTRTITVTAPDVPPVANFTADVTSGAYPLLVQFTDQSTGSPTAWSWNFGDESSSTSRNPLHAYSSPGTYTVTLTATNALGSNTTSKAGYITVSDRIAPVASFTASPRTGLAPLEVQFTDTSANAPASWSWDFGDGNTSTLRHPVHTYSATGSYTVNLSVTNAFGSNSLRSTGYITVTEPAIPVANFTVSRRAGIAPMSIQFNDTSAGYPISWAWDFGDGTTSTTRNPSHTYSAAGNYTVNLTATNTLGSNTSSCASYMAVLSQQSALSNYHFINLYMANDEGVKYDVPDGVYASGGQYAYVPNTYWVMFRNEGGGTNPLHISSKSNAYTSADVTTTTNMSGSFWVTHSGGQPTMAEGILMIAVNGIIPDDFKVNIRSSGQVFNVGTPVTGNQGLPAASTFIEGAVNQTFDRSDFIYGTQSWKPASVADYPIYVGENLSDPANQFQLMFIDLRAGTLQNGSLPQNGMIKVEYSFTNLTSFAAFNIYGWYMQSNHGTGIIMTNSGSGYMVVGSSAPVANFAANATTGAAPLAVQFTDKSTGTPTSWLWDFGDSSTSTEQNPVHTYTTGGTYSVNLTVTNDKGTNTITWPGYITVMAPLPNYNNIFFSVANDAGAKYNAYGNNTYYVSFKGANSGLNALHISTDPSVINGQVTVTGNLNGTFTATSNDAKGFQDDVILMVAVNGTIPDNFRLSVKADGYNWTPNPVRNQPPSPDNVTYQPGALNETFTKSDFCYGPQIWKPSANGYTYPIYSGQDMNATENTFQMMFIDLNAGVLNKSAGLENQGAVRINYSIHNLGSAAVFNVYAYTKNAANGNNIVAWTNALVSDKPMSGYMVANGYIPAPVANFSANITNGTTPLTVQFMDASTNTPTSWAWDFGDGSSATVQNPVYTYTTAGIFTVSLNATNAAGSTTITKTGYISVSGNTTDRARLSLPAASLYQDTATQLPVLVTSITGGTGISFDLAYDPAVIRVNEITLNQSYASGSSLTVNATSGLVRLSLTSTEGINIGSPVPVFLVNTTSTGAVGSHTPLTLTSAMWSDTTFNKRQLDTVNGSALVYRIRGDLNGNGWVDIGDTAKTAYMVVKLTPDLIPDADFNNNGRIDVGDATKIARYLVGKITEL